LHAGDMTADQRNDVSKKFELNLKKPGLTRCQKENVSLMWIEARKPYEAVVNNNIEKGRYFVTEGNGVTLGTVQPKIRKFRRWLEGWFQELFLEQYADSNTLKFRSFCSDNAAAHIKPFLSLNTGFANDSKE